jgi:hypothetical protein
MLALFHGFGAVGAGDAASGSISSGRGGTNGAAPVEVIFTNFPPDDRSERYHSPDLKT